MEENAKENARRRSRFSRGTDTCGVTAAAFAAVGVIVYAGRLESSPSRESLRGYRNFISRSERGTLAHLLASRGGRRSLAGAREDLPVLLRDARWKAKGVD